MRFAMLIFSCCAALAAADDSPRCSGEVLGEVWLTKVPRSAERWNSGPYPALVAQPWAIALLSKLQPLWSHMHIDAQHVLDALADSDHGRLTLSAPGDDDDTSLLMLLDVALREPRTGKAFINLMQHHLPVATRLGEDGPTAWLSGVAEAVLLDQRFVLRSTPMPGPIHIPEPFIMPNGSADLALTVLPRLLPAVVALMGLPEETLKESDFGEQRIRFTLEPFGLREHSEQDLTPADIDLLKPLHLPVINRRLFTALPAATLFAIVTASDAATTAALMASLKASDDQTFVGLDQVLAQNGLPDCATLASALDGDVVLWVEPGSPFPIATLTANLDEASARKILEALRAQVGLTLTDDGSVTGLVSLLTLSARWRDGVFCLTTDPLGLDAALSRRGGFTDHPEVQAALAEIAEDAHFAAVSRSAPSWDTLGRLSLLGLTTLKIPGINTMPRDLAAVARFGFLSYTVRDGVIILDAGGLFGGPITWIGLLSSGAFSYWCSMMDGPFPDEAVEAEADDAEPQ